MPKRKLESFEDVIARCGDYVAAQFRQFERDLPENVKAICFVDTSPKRLRITFTYMKKPGNQNYPIGFVVSGGSQEPPMPNPRDAAGPPEVDFVNEIKKGGK